jgi:RNA polymerase sigma factor FliA
MGSVAQKASGDDGGGTVKGESTPPIGEEVEAGKDQDEGAGEAEETHVFEGIYQQDLSDDEVIERFSSLVHKIAHTLYRHLQASIHFEDVLAYGMTGLLSAHRRFDEDYQVVFSTYAYYRIRGEILDGCRRSGSDVRNMKTLDELMAINSHYEQTLTQPHQSGRCTVECTSHLQRIFGDATIVHQLRRAARPLPPSQRRRIEQRQLREQLRKAMEDIGGKDKEILEMYYFEDMSMDEIGERLGMSKSWVSRVHTRAIDKVRRVLMENEEFCSNYDIIRV